MLYKKVDFGGSWGGGGARTPIIHVRLFVLYIFSDNLLVHNHLCTCANSEFIWFVSIGILDVFWYHVHTNLICVIILSGLWCQKLLKVPKTKL